MKKLLSVIVPAYKKEELIKKDLEDIERTLRRSLDTGFDYEILCVVDGAVDQTAAEARKIRSQKVRVYE